MVVSGDGSGGEGGGDSSGGEGGGDAGLGGWQMRWRGSVRPNAKYEPNCGRDVIKRTVSVGNASGGGGGDSMASNSCSSSNSSSSNSSSSSTASRQSKPTCKPSERPEKVHAHSLNQTRTLKVPAVPAR